MSWRIVNLSIAIIFPKTTIRVTEVKKNKIKWSLHVFCCLPCRNVRLVLVSMADMYQKQWHSFPVSSPLDFWEVYEFSVINGKYEKKKKKGGESGYRSWYLPHAKQALYRLS